MNMLLWTTQVTEEHFPLFEQLKNLGYTSVEVPISEGNAEYYRVMAQKIREAGLSCSTVTAMSVDKDPASPDPVVRAAAEDHLKWVVDMTVELGAHLLVGPLFAAHGYFDNPSPVEEARMNSAKVLKKVAQYAASRGVSLSIEFLNRFEIKLLNCSEDCASYLELINEENVGILYDSHHANIEEKSIEEAFTLYGHLFNHIHFSESNRATLGEGQVDWSSTTKALKGLGYKGGIAIEAFASDVEGFSEVAHVWRNLFSDKIQLCEQSINFAKKITA